MNFNNLPVTPVELDETKKLQLEEVMRAGNARLKFWHEAIKGRNSLGKSFTRLKFCGDLLRAFDAKCNTGPLAFMGQYIPHEDCSKIKQVQTAQTDIVACYIKIVGQIANKWNKKSNDTSLSISDLIAEGTKILLNCTFYFTDDERFSTFVYHAIYRQITKLCTRTSPLSERTEHATKLLREFKKQKAAWNGPCNFDEVCDKMGIEHEDRVLLERLQIGVIGGLTSSTDSDRTSADYSACALRFGNNYSVIARQSGVGNLVRKNRDISSDLNLEEIVQKANLTPFEQDVFKAWMEATNDRWRADFAENYISPISFKKVTRQRVSQVSIEVERKIREAGHALLRASA